MNFLLHIFLKKIIKINPQTVEEKPIEVSLPRNAYLLYHDVKDPDLLAVKNYLKKRGLTKRDFYRWRIMATSCGRHR